MPLRNFFQVQDS